jgi:hypothetical protein
MAVDGGLVGDHRSSLPGIRYAGSQKAAGVVKIVAAPGLQWTL